MGVAYHIDYNFGDHLRAVCVISRRDYYEQLGSIITGVMAE